MDGKSPTCTQIILKGVTISRLNQLMVTPFDSHTTSILDKGVL